MLFVACSGFPVPVSRYFREFGAVEISDTELAIPGAGTVRRWIRESPEGFAFTVLAPKAIAESGFAKSKENKAACADIADLSIQLDAQAIVFTADEGFKPTKVNKAALKAFIAQLPSKMPTAIFDLSAWNPAQVLDLAGKKKKKVVVAYDPLNDEPPPSNGVVYLRLPGPAGHRSRYDEASIDKIAEHCAAIEAETAFCVFCNIDMQTNVQALSKKLA